MSVVLRKLSFVGAIFAASLITVGAAAAQPVAAAPKVDPAVMQFSSPDGASSVAPEGDDFFTTVLHDPLDFSNPQDVDWPDGWRSGGISNGQWNGVGARGDANFFLLFPGFDIDADGIDTRDGQTNGIDPARYNHLVLKYTAPAPTSAVVYWMSPGDPYRRQVGNSSIVPLPAGTNIVAIDLNSRSASSGGVAWNTARWGGLRLSPSFNSPGLNIQVDWVRLVGENSATVNAAWTCRGCSGSVDLFADLDDNAGNGGLIKLASGVSASATTYQVPVEKLAPGSYYLVSKNNTGALSYSPGTFTVRPSPLIKITGPSTTSGEDFATTMLGQPWNMTNRNSIGTALNIANFTVANGWASGAPTTLDPSIFMLDGDHNQTLPAINTSRYKYLNFDLQVTRPGTVPFTMARVLWYSDPAHATTTGDLINWFDYPQHYNLDLRNINLATGTGWSGTPKSLRIDPNEDTNQGLPPQFKLGATTLTADPEVAQGGITAIRWNVIRGTGTVSIFYDRARNYSGTLIANKVPLSNGLYNWNVGNLATGSYWIRLVVNDGVNTVQFYGDAPLVVTPQGGVGTIAFSNPDGMGDVVNEGDDFFTSQLHDPIDFHNPEDATADYGWASHVQSSDGWVGTSSASDAYFFLLFPGYDGHPGTGRGQTAQIDPARYSHLVFKYTASADTAALVHWMSVGSPYAHHLGNSNIYAMEAGTHIIDIDLSNRTGSAGGALWGSESWGGLRLAPAFGSPGVTVKLEWVRLVAANAAPTVSANWTCANCVTSSFDIYADTDNNASNGGMVLLQRNLNPASGSSNVPVGLLPAGNYYLAAVSAGNRTVYSPGTFIVLNPNGYNDVPANNPFVTYINYLAQRGIIEGYNDNTFQPFQNASRGALARWVVRARGWTLVNPSTPTFTDVPTTDPNYRYVETAVQHGVISGYGAADCGGAGACFKPNNNVTRGQMAKMIVNAMGWATNTSGGPHFVDVPTNNPFYAQIETIYNRGLVSGYDRPAGGLEFRWGVQLTRSQLAKVLANSLQ